MWPGYPGGFPLRRLTLQTADDYAMLRLDKANYKIILPAFESRSGVKVETVAEER